MYCVVCPTLYLELCLIYRDMVISGMCCLLFSFMWLVWVLWYICNFVLLRWVGLGVAPCVGQLRPGYEWRGVGKIDMVSGGNLSALFALLFYKLVR